MSYCYSALQEEELLGVTPFPSFFIFFPDHLSFDPQTRAERNALSTAVIITISAVCAK